MNSEIKTPDFDEVAARYRERARLWMSDPEIREAMRVNREKIKQAKKEREEHGKGAT